MPNSGLQTTRSQGFWPEHVTCTLADAACPFVLRLISLWKRNKLGLSVWTGICIEMYIHLQVCELYIKKCMCVNPNSSLGLTVEPSTCSFRDVSIMHGNWHKQEVFPTKVPALSLALRGAFPWVCKGLASWWWPMFTGCCGVADVPTP